MQTSYRAVYNSAPEELLLEWYTSESSKGLGLTVTLQVGMESPQKEIYDICKPLLTTRSLSDVENVVSKVFTDDAVFTHAFIISKGKESIVRTYQFWKLVNKQIGFDIEDAVLSDKGDLLVLVNFNSHEYPWFWPFSFPAMKLHYDIKLRVVDTPQGKKFATQDDHLRIADTLLEIPGVKYVVTTVYLREIWGWIVTQAIASALMVASAVKKDLKKAS
ncbi:hypothetical protein WJX79_010659 [Trebouxia sp. C0005]|nr:MAG: hypothetical protein FRX49_07858 [Trebouxia sp. A1-2]